MKQLDAFGDPKTVNGRKHSAAKKRAVNALRAGYLAHQDGRPYFEVLQLGCFEARNEKEHSLHVKAWRYGHWLAAEGRPMP